MQTEPEKKRASRFKHAKTLYRLWISCLGYLRASVLLLGGLVLLFAIGLSFNRITSVSTAIVFNLLLSVLVLIVAVLTFRIEKELELESSSQKIKEPKEAKADYRNPEKTA